MSLSRAEKLEKLKAIREAEKKKKIDAALASLNELDKYLENSYPLEEEVKVIEKKESKIKNLISKFNQLLI
jgi:hypothetical protein